MGASIKACESILCHQDPDYNHVAFTCALAPSNDATICLFHPSSINKLGKDKLRRLMVGGSCETCYYNRGRTKSMPPYGYIIDVLEQMYTESIDDTWNDLSDPLRRIFYVTRNRTLGEENSSIDSDVCLCGRIKPSIERRNSRNEGCACEAS